MFCSIHKFVGGPGTPGKQIKVLLISNRQNIQLVVCKRFSLILGLLVAKKHVFINPVPSGVGGGTVLFVSIIGRNFCDNKISRLVF